MAERPALLNGITLTDHLAKLVCEDAPKTLKFHNEITLSNQQFDNFQQVCEDEASYELSDEIKHSVKQFDCGKKDINQFLSLFTHKPRQTRIKLHHGFNFR